MLMHTREGATVVWHSRKKIPTKPDNRWTIHFKDSALFDPFCCRERIISYLRWAVFIFTMDKPIWAKPSFTWYIFLKFDTSLAKSTTICLLEFFYRLSKKVLCPIFIWRGTSRDFVSCLVVSQPKKLAETGFCGSFNRFFRNFLIF